MRTFPSRWVTAMLVVWGLVGCQTIRWRPDSAAIGAAAPSRLVASDPAGRWVVLCQARDDTDHNGVLRLSFDEGGASTGDALVPHFIEGSGLGAPVQAYIGSDPTGRYVGLLQRDHLLLRDTVSGHDLDLTERGAVLPASATPTRPQGAIAFDKEGRRALFFRATGGGVQAVVRELSSGTEAPVATDSALLVGAEFDTSGHWLHERVVDGKGEVLRNRDDVRSTACAPLVEAAIPGNDLIERWQSLDAAVVVYNAVGTSGDQILVMRDRELVGVDPSGKLEVRAGATCGPVWRFSADAYDAIGVTCRALQDRLEIIHGKTTQDPHLILPPASSIRAATFGGSRLWVVHASNHPKSLGPWVPAFWSPVALLDLQGPRTDWELNFGLVAEGKRFSIVHTMEGTMLIEPGGNHEVIWATASETTTVEMPGQEAKRLSTGELQVRSFAGSWFLLADMVTHEDAALVNLETGEILEVPGNEAESLSVDRNGRVLRAAGAAGGGNVVGPLQWTAAERVHPPS